MAYRLRSDGSVSILLLLMFHSKLCQGTQENRQEKRAVNSMFVELNSLNNLDYTHSPFDSSFEPDGQETVFGTSNNTVVTAQTGSTGILPCRIHHIRGGIVSWIRRKDYHLLTVGLTTYSSDERFQTIHYQNTDDWALHIKYLQKRDEGTYECQVSSHPPMSIFIQLQIVEARAEISGPIEKYLKPGSALQLQCVILKTTEKPAYLFWYHNDRMVNYDTELGVNVTTDFMQRVSDLYIGSTKTTHTGNYSCVPNNARPARVMVHIFNGENPAAMQSSSPSTNAVCGFLLFLLTLNALFNNIS